MTIVTSDFRTAVGDRIEASHQMLAMRWLQELKRVVPVAEGDIFPGEALLGQMPALIRELGAFLKAPAEEAIGANAIITIRATELGRLRHAQHASVHQVLREYRALRTALGQFMKEESVRLSLPPTVAEFVELMERFDVAIDALLQTTIDTFVAAYTDEISRHTIRLEAFNRMVSHELRQPLSVFQFAIKLLKAQDTRLDASRQDQILATAERSVTRMIETLGHLVTLSKASDGPDNPLVQQVDLTALVGDIVEQLREMADARGVQIRMGRVPPTVGGPLPSMGTLLPPHSPLLPTGCLAGDLPQITIDAARLELVLVNLISNAIKYSDPDKSVRLVEVASVPSERPDVCTLRISDNGIGIADTDLRSIFARFYRGRPDRDQELGTSGLGLGLSIVADCVDALKGDLRVESRLGDGTTFILELPAIVDRHDHS